MWPSWNRVRSVDQCNPETGFSVQLWWCAMCVIVEAVGYRTCGTSGEWLGDKTNYSQCLVGMPPHFDDIVTQSPPHTQQPLPDVGTLDQVGLRYATSTKYKERAIWLHINVLFDFRNAAVFIMVTLTFDHFNSKWGHKSPVSCASFLPIFSLLRPSVLDLGSGPGQTDGQTDRQTDNGHQCIMLPPCGVWHNKQISYCKQIARQHSYHRIFRPGLGASRPCNFFSHLVWSPCQSWLSYIGGPKKLGGGGAAAAPWDEVWLTH